MANANEMTFWDHLDDLRKSIFHVLLVVAAAIVVLFFFKDFLFDSVVLAPSKSDFYLYRLIGADFSLSLINIEVTAQFLVHIKVTLICALIITFPFLIYKIWQFISPALYENEKQRVRGAFSFASLLFYLGLAVGYCVIFPLMLNFFVNYQVSADIPNTFSLNSYISLLTSMVLVFGILFEFPTIVALLSSLGIVTKELMREYRRHAICAVFILAAVITPSGDPFSMLIVALPLYLLYEFSIFICKKRV